MTGTEVTLLDDDNALPGTAAAIQLQAAPSTVSEGAGATSVNVTATVADGRRIRKRGR